MELRPAEPEDLRACTAMSSAVSSSHVWQFTMARDPAASLAASEFSMTLRCLRLPRPVVVNQPGASMATIWERATAAFVVAEAGSPPDGFIILALAEERAAATVARLIVRPESRRRGLGTNLLRAAAIWASGEGLGGLNAHCSARNHPAVAFFTRTGFTFTGYSEGYYPRGEVALFWQRAV